MSFNEVKDTERLDAAYSPVDRARSIISDYLTLPASDWPSYRSERKEVDDKARAWLTATTGEASSKYHELLYAVERCFPGESRHETALRYIRETERRSHQHIVGQQAEDTCKSY